MINLRDLEFEVLTLDCENDEEVDGFQYDEYSIMRVDNGRDGIDIPKNGCRIELTFNNVSDYDDAINNLYYVYEIDSKNDDNLSLVLSSKPDFNDFTSKDLIRTNRVYRHLYGVTLTSSMKRMIIFLCNMDNRVAQRYISTCTVEIMNILMKYFNITVTNRQS